MQQPNVLLVTIDSLRADSVHTDAADTPTLAPDSNDWIAYRQAFSQGPFTTFSMPSLFTSRYPSALSYVTFSESTVGVSIDDEPTVTTELADAGYDTAGFHSNPLLSNLFGFDRGFDTFDARLPFSNTDVFPGRAKILADKIFRLIRKHPYLPAENINERSLEWLDRRESENPFFLWLHYMDVHGPYIPKEGLHYLNKYRGERLWRKAVTNPADVTDEERERLRDLYRTEVEYTDAQLGRLFDGLRERGLWDETVVVATSDHGEGFGEHGTFSHPHRLYDELTHVPLLVRDPNRSGGNIEGPVQLLDVAPTIVDRVAGAVPDSFSGGLLPIGDSDDDASTFAISEADLVPRYNGSVRTDRYRYVRNDIEGREELYDLRSDPMEQDDVVDERPTDRDELAAILENHLSDPDRNVGKERDVDRVDIEEGDVQDRLEDLGYLE